MTAELSPLSEVPRCVMGRCTVCAAALKFGLHIPMQWGTERGKQEVHRENQGCHDPGVAAGSAEAEVELSCLLLLAIV